MKRQGRQTDNTDIVAQFAALSPHAKRKTWIDQVPASTREKLEKLREAFHSGKLPNFGGQCNTLAKVMVGTFNLPVSVNSVVRWLENKAEKR